MRQRSLGGILGVIKQIVEHQRHRLHISAVHDVIGLDRIPARRKFTQGFVQQTVASADVVPVGPHIGDNILVDS